MGGGGEIQRGRNGGRGGASAAVDGDRSSRGSSQQAAVVAGECPGPSSQTGRRVAPSGRHLTSWRTLRVPNEGRDGGYVCHCCTPPRAAAAPWVARLGAQSAPPQNGTDVVRRARDETPATGCQLGPGAASAVRGWREIPLGVSPGILVLLCAPRGHLPLSCPVGHCCAPAPSLVGTATCARVGMSETWAAAGRRPSVSPPGPTTTRCGWERCLSHPLGLDLSSPAGCVKQVSAASVLPLMRRTVSLRQNTVHCSNSLQRRLSPPAVAARASHRLHAGLSTDRAHHHPGRMRAPPPLPANRRKGTDGRGLADNRRMSLRPRRARGGGGRPRRTHRSPTLFHALPHARRRSPTLADPPPPPHAPSPSRTHRLRSSPISPASPLPVDPSGVVTPRPPPPPPPALPSPFCP